MQNFELSNPEANIRSLFLEKVNSQKNNEVKENTTKKPKKPPVIKPNIEDLELKYYEYETIADDIRIYNGLIPEKKKEMKRKIKLLKTITPTQVFSKIEPSVLSVQGGFKNILFNEELFMPFTTIPGKAYPTILKIGCNFGEVYAFPNIYEPHTLRGMLNSIDKLKGENIIIGCACQPPLDVKAVLELLKQLNANSDLYEVIKKYFTVQFLDSVGIMRTRINRIVRNFNNIIKFKTTDRDSIQEICNVIDDIVERSDVSKCNQYIELIKSIIISFTSYAKRCKC